MITETHVTLQQPATGLFQNDHCRVGRLDGPHTHLLQPLCFGPDAPPCIHGLPRESSGASPILLDGCQRDQNPQLGDHTASPLPSSLNTGFPGHKALVGGNTALDKTIGSSSNYPASSAASPASTPGPPVAGDAGRQGLTSTSPDCSQPQCISLAHPSPVTPPLQRPLHSLPAISASAPHQDIQEAQLRALVEDSDGDNPVTRGGGAATLSSQFDIISSLAASTDMMREGSVVREPSYSSQHRSLPMGVDGKRLSLPVGDAALPTCRGMNGGVTSTNLDAQLWQARGKDASTIPGGFYDMESARTRSRMPSPSALCQQAVGHRRSSEPSALQDSQPLDLHMQPPLPSWGGAVAPLHSGAPQIVCEKPPEADERLQGWNGGPEPRRNGSTLPGLALHPPPSTTMSSSDAFQHHSCSLTSHFISNPSPRLTPGIDKHDKLLHISASGVIDACSAPLGAIDQDSQNIPLESKRRSSVGTYWASSFVAQEDDINTSRALGDLQGHVLSGAHLHPSRAYQTTGVHAKEPYLMADVKAFRSKVNRIDGGIGGKMTLGMLKGQFGKPLKDAADSLGMCSTTLKRACRRLGIKRWPRTPEAIRMALSDAEEHKRQSDKKHKRSHNTMMKDLTSADV